MNNQVQLGCLWCCVPPDFVVQINNSLAWLYFKKGKKRKEAE